MKYVISMKLLSSGVSRFLCDTIKKKDSTLNLHLSDSPMLEGEKEDVSNPSDLL